MMAVTLTADMRAVIQAAHLCFAATVSPDGMPNVSPKGTIRVWDDQHLFFLDLASPGTRANLQARPWMELNVVDQLSGAAIDSSDPLPSMWGTRCLTKPDGASRPPSQPRIRSLASSYWRWSGPQRWFLPGTGGSPMSGQCAYCGASGGRRWIRSSRPTWLKWNPFGYRAEAAVGRRA
jgi:hypothetical protein